MSEPEAPVEMKEQQDGDGEHPLTTVDVNSKLEQLELLADLAELEKKVPVVHPLYDSIVQKIQKVRRLILAANVMHEDEVCASLQKAFDKLELSDSLPVPTQSATASSYEYQDQMWDDMIKETRGFRFTSSNSVDAVKLAMLTVPLEIIDVDWSPELWDSVSTSWEGNLLKRLLNSSMKSLKTLKIDAFKLFHKSVTASRSTFPSLEQLHLISTAPNINTVADAIVPVSPVVAAEEGINDDDDWEPSTHQYSPVSPKYALRASKSSKQRNKFKTWDKRPIIPSRINLAQVFPHLTTIILELPAPHKFGKYTLGMYFPGDDFSPNSTSKLAGAGSGTNIKCQAMETTTDTADIFTSIDVVNSVKNLALGCQFNRYGLVAFAKKFPNVRNILVKNVLDIFSSEEAAWFLPWEHLAYLELRGFAFGNDFNFHSRSLDSFFTGLPKDILSNLYKFDQNKVTTDPRVLTVYRSVRDLQTLEKLRIVFNDPKNVEWKGANLEQEPTAKNKTGKGLPPISKVTGLYGFNLMPQLKDVTFAYDFNQANSQDMAAALAPLAQFVKFVHHPLESSIGGDVGLESQE